jgi:ribosome-interacting GTPase 1
MNKQDLEKKINKIICDLSDNQGYISSIDVLIKLDYLSKTDYEKWRNGKIDYLERVCKVNLGKLTTINKIIKEISNKMQFVPSLTVYNKYGKGPKIKLRFSKSGADNIEKAYSTHYINKYQIKKIKDIKNKNNPAETQAVTE